MPTWILIRLYETPFAISAIHGRIIGFDAETCGVLISIKEQSDDIKQGVDTALEAREGSMSESDIEATGAGGPRNDDRFRLR